MAPRPTWKGYLRLSLVSCPVRLYPATTRSERVSFHLLNPKTHNRIELRPHDPETDEEIPRDQLVRGYEFDNGRYVVVDQPEIDALRIASSETIDLLDALKRSLAAGDGKPPAPSRKRARRADQSGRATAPRRKRSAKQADLPSTRCPPRGVQPMVGPGTGFPTGRHEQEADMAYAAKKPQDRSE